jgi:hypothetical protein
MITEQDIKARRDAVAASSCPTVSADVYLADVDALRQFLSETSSTLRMTVREKFALIDELEAKRLAGK